MLFLQKATFTKICYSTMTCRTQLVKKTDNFNLCGHSLGNKNRVNHYLVSYVLNKIIFLKLQNMWAVMVASTTYLIRLINTLTLVYFFFQNFLKLKHDSFHFANSKQVFL